jgi:hypothetical protein
MVFLLCPRCRLAWIASAVTSCCAETPITCSPWSNDGRKWYVARVRHKVAGIHEVLLTNHWYKWSALARGIKARGNRDVVWRV